jgi:hypothetical protein
MDLTRSAQDEDTSERRFNRSGESTYAGPWSSGSRGVRSSIGDPASLVGVHHEFERLSQLVLREQLDRFAGTGGGQEVSRPRFLYHSL